MNQEDYRQRIQSAIELKQLIVDDSEILSAIEQAIQLMVDSLQNGGKVLFCGNGGSAADSQHLAAELSGRFYIDRPALFAEALHENPSYLTAAANDYSYEEVFARAVEAKGKAGDVLVGLSTSGNSPNVVRAFEKAQAIGIKTIGFTGQKVSQLDSLSDIIFKVPSTDTPRVQEAHMLLGHIICEAVEVTIFG